MKEIVGKMPGGGYSHEDSLESVVCLDPWMVLNHFHDEFGESLVVDPTDHGRKDYEYFREQGDTSGALRVAERDAMRRGPILAFSIEVGGAAVNGHVERYRIRIRIESENVDVTSRLMTVLERLPAPGLSVEVTGDS